MGDAAVQDELVEVIAADREQHIDVRQGARHGAQRGRAVAESAVPCGLADDRAQGGL